MYCLSNWIPQPDFLPDSLRTNFPNCVFPLLNSQVGTCFGDI